MPYSSLFYSSTGYNPHNPTRNPSIDSSSEGNGSPQPCDITAHIQYLQEYPYPIDSGGFSDIYKADFDGRAVAVKVMRDIKVRDRRNRDSLARVRLLPSLLL